MPPTNRSRARRRSPAPAEGGASAGKELKVVGKEPAPAVTNDEYRARYLDTIAPIEPSSAGDIKYSPKDGAFVVDEETEVPEDATFAALCGQTLVGFREVQRPRRSCRTKRWACSIRASSCRK